MDQEGRHASDQRISAGRFLYRGTFRNTRITARSETCLLVPFLLYLWASFTKNAQMTISFS